MTGRMWLFAIAGGIILSGVIFVLTPAASTPSNETGVAIGRIGIYLLVILLVIVPILRRTLRGGYKNPAVSEPPVLAAPQSWTPKPWMGHLFVYTCSLLVFFMGLYILVRFVKWAWAD